MTEGPPEYAPQYDSAARRRIVALGVLAILAIWVANRLWIRPWLDGWAQQGHCQRVLGMNGESVLFAVIFVGLPVAGGLMAAATFGRVGVRALRSGQMPPPGMKVMRRTRVERGARARRQAVAFLVLPAAFALIAAWGGFQARRLAALAEARASIPALQSQCAAAGAARPDPATN